MATKRFDLSELQQIAAGTSADLQADSRMALELIDVIDGKYVLRPVVRLANGEASLGAKSLPAGQPLKVSVSQGNAQIERDPYTGMVLVSASGTVPVKVQASLEAQYLGNSITLVSPEAELGIDPATVPSDQSQMVVAGGGACAANWMLGEEHQFTVRVRSNAHLSVIPRSTTQREIFWRHGLYFAHDEHLGLMRISYNPDHCSRTVMQAQPATAGVQGNGFFPADGQNELFFTMEFVDLGFKLFNKEAMVLPFKGVRWPPFGTPLNIAAPVNFYSVDNPDQVVLSIQHNEMQLYDYSSVQVECLDYKVTQNGELQSRWRLRNEAMAPVRARWFVLGDHIRSAGVVDEGNRLMGPAGSGLDTYEVVFTAQLRKSTLTQLVSMNVVSLNDPVVHGAGHIRVRYPEA